MAKKYLKQAQSLLPEFFTFFKNNNILVVSEDKASLPFALLVYENEHPNVLLVSLAIDYPDSVVVAHMILALSQKMNIALSDVFYISPSDGHTHFNEEAYDKWQLSQFDLGKIPALSEEVH